MNLRHLEHLLAVADTGSFSRAAEQQHLTQSALSRSIQALEDELGARLIDRVGKRNELTPLGQAVAQRARRIALEAAELRRRAAPQRRATPARRLWRAAHWPERRARSTAADTVFAAYDAAAPAGASDRLARRA